MFAHKLRTDLGQRRQFCSIWAAVSAQPFLDSFYRVVGAGSVGSLQPLSFRDAWQEPAGLAGSPGVTTSPNRHP